MLAVPEYDALLRNGLARAAFTGGGVAALDFLPVVKLFTPDAACIWLLTELDPDNHDIAFGLCDLGWDTPEFGPVCLSALRQIQGKLGRRVERDRHFRPLHTISVYARAARNAGYITEDPQALAQAAKEAGSEA